MEALTIQNLSKSYSLQGKKLPVLENLSFTAEMGKITVLLGKSGCGKTTLLRLISRLEKPDSGQICIPGNLQVGMMFQEARLLPWLSCRDNITFGLRERLLEQELDQLLQLVGLSDFAQAYPHQLSGGMQQRAALARTLARRSGLILMDEPFAALDYFTRLQMQQEVLKVKRLRGSGFLLVTHNIDEALAMGDKLLLLQEGKIARELNLPDEEARDVLREPYLSAKKEILKVLLADA